MNLATYIEDMDRRRQLAAAVGSDAGYLWQVATGWKGRKASPDLAKKIELATGGQVTRHDLRPDIFGVAQVAIAPPLDSAA